MQTTDKPYSTERYDLLLRLTESELLFYAAAMGFMTDKVTHEVLPFDLLLRRSYPDDDPLEIRGEVIEEIRQALAIECDCFECAPVLNPMFGYAASLPPVRRG